jgi:hypothetical protein
VAAGGIVDQVGTDTDTGTDYRVLGRVDGPLRYVLIRAATADDPSTVSIVIRGSGLAACSWFLVASLIKGRGQRRYDSEHWNAADR